MTFLNEEIIKNARAEWGQMMGQLTPVKFSLNGVEFSAFVRPATIAGWNRSASLRDQGLFVQSRLALAADTLVSEKGNRILTHQDEETLINSTGKDQIIKICDAVANAQGPQQEEGEAEKN